MAKADFKCARCGRTFSMKAHLARHNSAVHGRKTAKKKIKKKKKVAKRGARRKVARRKTAKKRPARATRGRSRISSRLRLEGLSIDELTALFNAVKTEAQKRISNLRRAMK
jgi:hypothetical protein